MESGVARRFRVTTSNIRLVSGMHADEACIVAGARACRPAVDTLLPVSYFEHTTIRKIGGLQAWTMAVTCVKKLTQNCFSSSFFGTSA